MTEIKTEQGPNLVVQAEEKQDVVAQGRKTPVGNLESESKESSHGESHHHHKRRRRRHRRKVHKRDPEEVKEIKLENLNNRREAHWNNRFSNDTIPDIFEFRPKKYKVNILRKDRSPVRSAYEDPHAFAPNKLPNITSHNTEKGTKKPEKSFKVRSITRKYDRKDQKRLRSQARNRTVDPIQSKQQERPTEKVKEKLMIQFIEKTQIHQVPDFYKDLLRDSIEALKGKKTKGIRQFLEEQVASIGTNDNIVTHIQASIAERQSLARKTKEEAQPAKLAEKLQTVSIGLVEEVLQFNTKWENTLSKLGIGRKVRFMHDKENYLLIMHRDTAALDTEGNPDPFVLALTNPKEGDASKRQEEVSLKVRACELLLLEEQLRKEGE